MAPVAPWELLPSFPHIHFQLLLEPASLIFLYLYGELISTVCNRSFWIWGWKRPRGNPNRIQQTEFQCLEGSKMKKGMHRLGKSSSTSAFSGCLLFFPICRLALAWISNRIMESLPTGSNSGIVRVEPKATQVPKVEKAYFLPDLVPVCFLLPRFIFYSFCSEW